MAVNSGPTAASLSLNCTPATPTLSDALATNVAVLDTIAPSTGAVTATAGGVASAAENVTSR